MDGLPTKKNHFASAPICLLYVNSSKQLVPIAIQLRQGVREEDKKEPNPIFLPSDGWYDWLLAKIYYQSAQAQVSWTNDVTHALRNYFRRTNCPHITYLVMPSWKRMP